MKEIWVGTHFNGPFRVTVDTVTGKIVNVEGRIPWAKGCRIRQFKRTIWRGYGDVSLEEPDAPVETVAKPEAPPDEKSIEDLPQAVETCEKVPEDRLSRQRREILITSGMNLRDALQAAEKLGCYVRTVRRKGEVRISHPRMGKRINANRRKKNASRVLTTFLSQLQDQLSS